MSIWKTLREEKPNSKFGRILVLTTSGQIAHVWFHEANNKFYSRYGLVKRITNYKRWCYEKDLVKQILKEINVNY